MKIQNTFWQRILATASITVTLTLVAIAVPSTSNAQFQVFEQNGGQGIQEQFQQQLNRYRQDTEQRLQVRIGDIDRTCELNEAQTKKLRIASKGVVSALVRSRAKQLMQSARQMNNGTDFELDVDGDGSDDDSEDDEDPEEDDVLDQQDGVMLRVQQAFIGGPAVLGQGDTKVESHPLWRKVVRKTLTDEQRTLYHEASKDRQAFQRQRATLNFVAKVDHHLLLSTQQRQQLTPLIDQEFGSLLADKMARDDSGQQQMFWQVAGVNNGQPAEPPMDHKKLSFLTSAQLDVWTNKIESDLRQLALPGQANNVFMLAAPAAAGEMKIELSDDENEDKKNDN